MKRFEWAIAILLLLALAPFAHADSFTITQITVLVGSNSGSGDNVAFSLTGPGTNISGGGGTACFSYLCSPLAPVLPGTFSPEIGDISISNFFTVMVGGQNYDPSSEISLTADLFISVFGSINLAADGSTTSACAPAGASGPITGFVGSGDTFKDITLNLPKGGTFCTTWSFSDGQYTFGGGEFTASAVPEPGTLGLMGSGLISLIVMARRKRKA